MAQMSSSPHEAHASQGMMQQRPEDDLDTMLQTQAELERALTHWRRMGEAVEQSDLQYLQRGRYEDYMAAISMLAAVLTRYTTVEALLTSWNQQTLRSAVERARILAPGRGVLNAQVLEGAAYWRRFCQLVAEHID
jgi:hypothetical protein